MSDLNQVDANILATVMTNTRLRQVFGVSDPNEIKQLVEVSGERSIFLRTFSAIFRTYLPLVFYRDESWSESISPRLRVNDFIEATDHQFRSIFLLRRSQGNAQFGGYPFIIESTFHISKDEYQQRVLAPWPEPTLTAKLYPSVRLSVDTGNEGGPTKDASILHDVAHPIPPVEKTSSSPATEVQTPSKEVIDSLLSTLDKFKKT